MALSPVRTSLPAYLFALPAAAMLGLFVAYPLVASLWMSFTDYNLIWSSPVIPQDPFVVSSKLCDDLVEQITNAFLTLGDSPEGQDYLKNVNASRFVAMSDADYDIIRALKAAKDAKKN